MHEDLKLKADRPELIQVVRKHTLTILGQLSKQGFNEATSTELISVRQSLRESERDGAEGASNLLYYLFEDWQGTFLLRLKFSDQLEKLVSLPYTAFQSAKLTSDKEQ